MGYKFNPFTGNLDEVGAGGATSPGGSTTQVQFNDGGAFGGDVDLTWNKTTNLLTVAGDVNLSDGGTYTTTLQTITATANRTISLPDATGTVALVGGSSGQLVYNNAGVNAGASTLTYDGSILTTSGRFINSYNATASAPAKTFTGTWFTGGTSTTTKPQVLIEPTGTTSTAWSTSGTGLGVNAASGFAGNLLDLQVNGTSQLAVASDGQVVRTLLQIGESTSAKRFQFQSADSGGLTIGSGCSLSWRNALTVTAGSNDLSLTRDAADTLAQRRGTNAQVFRVYNTITSSTNYELGKLEWTSNVFRIGTEKGSGGGTARALEFQTDGTTRATIDSSGRVGVATASPYRTQTLRGTGEILQFDLNTTANNSYASITWNGGNVDLGINAQSVEIRGYREAGTAWGALAFHTRDASNTSLERVRIDSSGRLLVGTSTNAGGALFQVNDNRIRVATAKTPASATDTGSAGEICWDADYIYVCTATNTWKRAALATW